MEGAVCEGAGDGVAAVDEDVGHAAVGGQGPGLEGVVAEGAAEDGQVLEQQAADAASLQLVGDREGDLGHALAVAVPAVLAAALDGAADADDALAAVLFEHHHQGEVTVEVELGVEVELAVGEAALGLEEALRHRVLRQAVEVGVEALPVVRPDGAQHQRRVVGEADAAVVGRRPAGRLLLWGGDGVHGPSGGQPIAIARRPPHPAGVPCRERPIRPAARRRAGRRRDRRLGPRRGVRRGAPARRRRRCRPPAPGRG